MELVLHIGQMKSGTTYIQRVLANNRDSLRTVGWTYPGRRENQQHAVYGLCGRDIFWVSEVKAEWSRLAEALVRSVTRAEERSVVSAEALSVLSSEGIARAITKLGRPRSVLITVRNLQLTLPSAWQQWVKSRYTGSIGDFFRQLSKDRPSLGGHWRTYAFGEVVKRWAEHAPVTAIVVPPMSAGGPSALWGLFSEAAGLPAYVDTGVNPEDANISVNMETTEVLRAMNAAMASADLPDDQMVRLKNSYLREFVAPSAHPPRGTPVRPPADFSQALDEWNREELDKLRKNAAGLTGDISHLEFYRGSYGDANGGEISPIALELARQYIGFWRMKMSVVAT